MATKVNFILPAEIVGEATSGLLLGEFNNWNYEEGVSLKKQKDGSLKTTISLEEGKSYQYRYLLNDGRWVNDNSATNYVHVSGYHVENCIVHVPAKEAAPKKKATKAKAEAVEVVEEKPAPVKVAKVAKADKAEKPAKAVSAPKEKAAAPAKTKKATKK